MHCWSSPVRHGVANAGTSVQIRYSAPIYCPCNSAELECFASNEEVVGSNPTKGANLQVWCSWKHKSLPSFYRPFESGHLLQFVPMKVTIDDRRKERFVKSVPGHLNVAVGSSSLNAAVAERLSTFLVRKTTSVRFGSVAPFGRLAETV